MGAVDHDAALGHLVDVSTKVTPRAAEVVDDVPVMHDLMEDVDRRPLELQHLVDHVDGHVDAGTEAAGIGEDDFHVGKFKPTSCL